MKDKCYLVLSNSGVMRMTKGLPPLKAGEIAVKVEVEVSNEIFVRPIITAKVAVGKDAVSPLIIDAGTLQAVEQNIRDGLGVNVALGVLDPAPEAS